jgi:hypothetical protein
VAILKGLTWQFNFFMLKLASWFKFNLCGQKATAQCPEECHNHLFEKRVKKA